jgi:hypothetical protein
VGGLREVTSNLFEWRITDIDMSLTINTLPSPMKDRTSLNSP